MPLPTPNLDDRLFQDIVDDAKRRIPYYCPEWTDHNVSDPGIALVELFAWMTEMLIYRINQVPDKNYVKFLELIGVTLKPPEAAQVPVTFYLSAPQPTSVTIPHDTEVATVRTESNPAIVFATTEDLVLRPALVLAGFTRTSGSSSAGWIAHDLQRLELPSQSIALFSDPPVPGSAFYLALENDFSHHLLALSLECDNAGGAGVDPNHPPVQWEVWQSNLAPWAPCVVEYDRTKGFNVDGEILLHAPQVAPAEFQGTTGYWLRCRLTDKQADKPRYEISPRLRGPLKCETRGGTVRAHHGTTIYNEFLGHGDGKPGATFKLLNPPILPRNETGDTLIVTTHDGEMQYWQEVKDFAESGPDDNHFTVDSVDGTLKLGPSLIQPDGSCYAFGRVPPAGSVLTFGRYQHGGGTIGNVPRGAISVMKSSIPYVSRVNNRERASQGKDAQSLEDAKVRAPLNLRTRKRAVTREDFEYLATQVTGVARACCIGPGPQPGDPANPKPGQVWVIVLPSTDLPPTGAIPPADLVLSAELRAKVLSYVTHRCLLGCQVDVRPPQYIWVEVQANLRAAEGTHPSLLPKIKQAAEEKMYAYLNPLTGGPRGEGWPFGRELYLSEIQALLHGIQKVEFVDDVVMSLGEPGGGSAPRIAPPRLAIPKHGLICSLEHRITVS